MIDKKGILKDLQERAALKGGKCLSKEYVNSSAPLLWQCEKGHTWETSSAIIKQGSWCPACVSKSSRKLSLEQMQELAISKGGKCLSTEYINIRTKLEWQCREGHTWMALGSGIKSGNWCPYCAGFAKLTIEEMQQLAIKKGGQCLSKRYINSYTPLLWQCQKGHKWKAKPGQVKNKSWCPSCSHNKGSIELMQQIAESKGGKCLSKKYTDNKTHLKFQCKEGHTWKSIPLHITIKNSWCPHCAGTARLTIKQMRELGKSKGGRCLSTEYIDNKTKLTWQCNEGHIWESKPNDIQQGYWCPYCAGTARATIEQVKDLAKSKGGKCLSREYINNATKLTWQCKKGHVWETKFAVIKKGGWCPYCAGKAKHTIEQMHQWAKEKDGKCLSKIYVNNSIKLTWQCKEEHTWEAPSNYIQQGKWCPTCYWLRRKNKLEIK